MVPARGIFKMKAERAAFRFGYRLIEVGVKLEPGVFFGYVGE